jgi:hypothetical protein
VIGPPLASFCFVLATTVSRYGLAGLATLDIAFVTGTWPFAYLLAIVPTLVAAAGNALVARWALSQISRLALSLPIGAIPFLLSLGWLAEDDVAGQMQVGELVSLGVAGAMTSLLCVALVESFGTTLREQR